MQNYNSLLESQITPYGWQCVAASHESAVQHSRMHCIAGDSSTINFCFDNFVSYGSTTPAPSTSLNPLEITKDIVISEQEALITAENNKSKVI